MKIHFTRMLWDEDAKAMRPHQFELTVDVTKLKPITLNGPPQQVAINQGRCTVPSSSNTREP